LHQYFSVTSVEIETRARLPIENDENEDVIPVSWRIGDRDVSPTFDVLAIGPKRTCLYDRVVRAEHSFALETRTVPRKDIADWKICFRCHKYHDKS